MPFSSQHWTTLTASVHDQCQAWLKSCLCSSQCGSYCKLFCIDIWTELKSCVSWSTFTVTKQLCTTLIFIKFVYLSMQILQGNVAIDLRLGGRFNSSFLCSSFRAERGFQSYCKNKNYIFLDPRCRCYWIKYTVIMSDKLDEVLWWGWDLCVCQGC